MADGEAEAGAAAAGPVEAADLVASAEVVLVVEVQVVAGKKLKTPQFAGFLFSY